MQLVGQSSNGALSVTQLITGSTFGVTMTGNKSVTDVVIVGVFANSALGGTLNGTSFTSMAGFPEGNTGAIGSTLAALNICSSCTLSFGYVDLHTGLSAGNTINVTISGVPRGTILYAVGLNRGKIAFITPNSEAGVYLPPIQVPEPGSLSLFGLGLMGTAGAIRRRFKRS